MQLLLDDPTAQVAIVSRHRAERISILSGARVLRFADLTEAERFLRGFVRKGGRPDLGMGPGLPASDEVLRSLARRILAGELFVVSTDRREVVRRHERPIYATPREVATPPPPPPAPSPRPETPPEEETLVPNPVAQAVTLEAAAQSGAPLCDT